MSGGTFELREERRTGLANKGFGTFDSVEVLKQITVQMHIPSSESLIPAWDIKP
jgi:hypothetical protein